MALFSVNTALPLGARTASGSGSGVFPTSVSGNISVVTTVSARTGTAPTLTTRVEWSFDGGQTFINVGDTLPASNNPGSVGGSFPVRAPHYRIAWTIGGTTPDFTFEVKTYLTR